MNTRARARKLVQEGIAALKANDTATAATRFQQATELTPDDPVGWVWRASITTDVQEKQQYLKWAVMIAPESDAGKRAQSELKRIEQEERERQERERLERERQEQERLAREQQERERQEREQAEQAQAAAAQSRGKWGIPAAQTLNKFLSSAKDMVNEHAAGAKANDAAGAKAENAAGAKANDAAGAKAENARSSKTSTTP